MARTRLQTIPQGSARKPADEPSRGAISKPKPEAKITHPKAQSSATTPSIELSCDSTSKPNHKYKITYIGAKTPPKKKWGFWEAEEEVLRRGPNGKPVYDNLGYELDYKKVAKSTRRRSKASRGGAKYMEMIEREARERARQAEIMGMNRDSVSAFSRMAWNTRVSTDLEIPYHKVTMQSFEEWKARGFEAQPGEFDPKNMSEEYRKQINDLTSGSAFRK